MLSFKKMFTCYYFVQQGIIIHIVESRWGMLKIKKKIKDYLNRLAKANESSFGTGKGLDCCKLNKKDTKKLDPNAELKNELRWK